MSSASAPVLMNTTESSGDSRTAVVAATRSAKGSATKQGSHGPLMTEQSASASSGITRNSVTRPSSTGQQPNESAPSPGATTEALLSTEPPQPAPAPPPRESMLPAQTTRVPSEPEQGRLHESPEVHQALVRNDGIGIGQDATVLSPTRAAGTDAKSLPSLPAFAIPSRSTSQAYSTSQPAASPSPSSEVDGLDVLRRKRTARRAVTRESLRERQTLRDTLGKRPLGTTDDLSPQSCRVRERIQDSILRCRRTGDRRDSPRDQSEDVTGLVRLALATGTGPDLLQKTNNCVVERITSTLKERDSDTSSRQGETDAWNPKVLASDLHLKQEEKKKQSEDDGSSKARKTVRFASASEVIGEQQADQAKLEIEKGVDETRIRGLGRAVPDSQSHEISLGESGGVQAAEPEGKAAPSGLGDNLMSKVESLYTRLVVDVQDGFPLVVFYPGIWQNRLLATKAVRPSQPVLLLMEEDDFDDELSPVEWWSSGNTFHVDDDHSSRPFIAISELKPLEYGKVKVVGNDGPSAIINMLYLYLQIYDKAKSRGEVLRNGEEYFRKAVKTTESEDRLAELSNEAVRESDIELLVKNDLQSPIRAVQTLFPSEQNVENAVRKLYLDTLEDVENTLLSDRAASRNAIAREDVTDIGSEWKYFEAVVSVLVEEELLTDDSVLPDKYEVLRPTRTPRSLSGMFQPGKSDTATSTLPKERNALGDCALLVQRTSARWERLLFNAVVGIFEAKGYNVVPESYQRVAPSVSLNSKVEGPEKAIDRKQTEEGKPDAISLHNRAIFRSVSKKQLKLDWGRTNSECAMWIIRAQTCHKHLREAADFLLPHQKMQTAAELARVIVKHAKIVGGPATELDISEDNELTAVVMHRLGRGINWVRTLSSHGDEPPRRPRFLTWYKCRRGAIVTGSFHSGLITWAIILGIVSLSAVIGALSKDNFWEKCESALNLIFTGAVGVLLGMMGIETNKRVMITDFLTFTRPIPVIPKDESERRAALYALLKPDVDNPSAHIEGPIAWMPEPCHGWTRVPEKVPLDEICENGYMYISEGKTSARICGKEQWLEIRDGTLYVAGLVVSRNASRARVRVRNPVSRKEWAEISVQGEDSTLVSPQGQFKGATPKIIEVREEDTFATFLETERAKKRKRSVVKRRHTKTYLNRSSPVLVGAAKEQS